MANLLISVDDLREVCGLSNDFDANYLEPMLVQSTDLAAQNILGTALTIKIREDYNADALAGLYLSLWDSDYASVRKMICWQAYQLGLPRMLWKIGAATISSGDTESETSITSDDLGVMIRQADATRVGYENRVKEFLVNNRSSIPELADTTLGYLQDNTEEVNTSMGMSFGKNIIYDNF